MRRTIRSVLLVLSCLAVAFAAGGPGSAADEKVFSYAENGHVVLDPAYASYYRLNDERMIVAVQECLTVLDPATGKAKPGAASSWTASGDRKTWTFRLRKDAKWSDGSPVTAADFLRAWKRMLDPFTEDARWAWLYRSIRGCATITDNSARSAGFTILRKGLRELRKANPNGIPGDDLNSLLDDTGVRPYLAGIKKRSVKKMLVWSSDQTFLPEMSESVIDELRKARKKHKDLWEEEFARFGKPSSGVHAPDPLTLVVKTEGDVPFLPELLARSAFAPLHKSLDEKRGQAFQAGDFVNNGPFMLKGRGPRPSQSERITSVVELVRNPHYNGPNPAKVDKVMCYTDLTLQVAAASQLDQMEDVRQFTTGQLDWVYCTWPEYPRKDRPRRKAKKKQKIVDLRQDIENLPGYTVRKAPRVIFLRFRCDKAPFESKDARKAFALSLDRDQLASMFWPKAEPAMRLVPPGIEGRTDGISCPRPDPNAAKAAASAAGFKADTWIEFSFGESPGQDDVASALIDGWKARIGLEPSKDIKADDFMRKVLRSGGFEVMLTDYRGFVSDPYGYLAPLHSGDAESGLGWRDEAFDAMLDAARDPDIALGDADGWLKAVGDALRGPLEGAKAGQAGRARFREACLAAAERRLLDEYVVVPLLFLNEAVLVGKGVSGMGTPKALENPGFVGSLIHVTK